MDGFEADTLESKPVLVIAATNRAEILDSALCRPGRFDRLVRVGLPGEKSRLAILKVGATSAPRCAVLATLARLLVLPPCTHIQVNPNGQVHARGVQMQRNVNLHSIAAASDGLSGADLANVVNEAALLAVRRGLETVPQECLEQALSKVVVAKAR